MLFIRVERKKASYNYKRDPKKPDDWQNNDNNSCLDFLNLFVYEELLYKAKCQTVANIPGGRFVDTIAPGPFLIKCFIDQRQFHCPVHGICQTNDLEYEYIDDNSVQKTDNTRWLIHDDQKLKPNPPGQITRIPWSAGCFVLHKSDFEGLNTIFHAFKIQPGDTIDGELIDVD